MTQGFKLQMLAVCKILDTIFYNVHTVNKNNLKLTVNNKIPKP